jgi:hypothetical protein
VSLRRLWLRLTPTTYPNGLPIGTLRILITDEADESLSADQVLDALSGFLGGRRLAVVTVLDAEGRCLAKRTLRTGNADRVRELLANELTTIAVPQGAPPPADLQTRLDRIPAT